MSPYYKYFSSKAPTCPRCETRAVYLYPNGRQGQSCSECRAAEQALARYWASVGLSLRWDKQQQRWLHPIPPSVRVA